MVQNSPKKHRPVRLLPCPGSKGDLDRNGPQRVPKECPGTPKNIYTWYFQLDDSKSLHKKWLFSNQTSILNLLFRIACLEFPIPKTSPKNKVQNKFQNRLSTRFIIPKPQVRSLILFGVVPLAILGESSQSKCGSQRKKAQNPIIYTNGEVLQDNPPQIDPNDFPTKYDKIILEILHELP